MFDIREIRAHITSQGHLSNSRCQPTLAGHVKLYSRDTPLFEEFGGAVVYGTVTKAMAMIRDPDGQLLELLSDGWLAALPPGLKLATRVRLALRVKV